MTPLSIKSISCLMAVAVMSAMALPTPAAARGEDRPWWEKSNCQGFKGVSWIECQKAVSQNKRDRKAGREPSNAAWWNESKCLGLEGASWASCQKARSDAKQNPGNLADPWTGNKCLGLAGLAFVECHKERKRQKRDGR
jgi:hypothetical protein